MDNSLEIKVERLHRLNNAGALKAFVDLNVNDSILLKGISVVEGKNGLFVSMPKQQGKDKKWYETIKCLSTEARKAVAESVLEAYKEDKE